MINNVVVVATKDDIPKKSQEKNGEILDEDFLVLVYELNNNKNQSPSAIITSSDLNMKKFEAGKLSAMLVVKEDNTGENLVLYGRDKTTNSRKFRMYNLDGYYLNVMNSFVMSPLKDTFKIYGVSGTAPSTQVLGDFVINENDPANDKPTPPPPKKNGSVWKVLLIIFCIVIVVGLGAFGFLYYMKRKEEIDDYYTGEIEGGEEDGGKGEIKKFKDSDVEDDEKGSTLRASVNDSDL